MFQMPADLVTAGGVAGVVGFDLNYAAVGFEQEVMGGFRVREAHRLVAAPIHIVQAPVVRLVLSAGERDTGDKECENGQNVDDVFHDNFSFFFARFEWRSLSGASAVMLARPT